MSVAAERLPVTIDTFLANLPPEDEKVIALTKRIQEEDQREAQMREPCDPPPGLKLYGWVGDPRMRNRGASDMRSMDRDCRRVAFAESHDTFEYTSGMKRVESEPIPATQDDVEVHNDELEAALEDFKHRVRKHYGDDRAIIERNGKITCRCPAHDDSNPSLGVKICDDKIVLKCLAGCTFAEVVASVGMKQHQFFRGLTIAGLADEKQIPVERLQAWGVTQAGKRISMDYLRDGGIIACTRYRQRESDGSPKIVCKTGDNLALYGECSRCIPSAKEAGYAVFVEGESDCWTLWLHDIPAYGVPGATCANVIQTRHVEGLRRVYVWQEPDKAGAGFVSGVKSRLAKLAFKGEIIVIKHDEFKDPSDLHCSGTNWTTAWSAIVSKGVALTIDASDEADPETPEEPRGKHRYGQMGELITDAMKKAGEHPLYIGGRFYTFARDHYEEVGEPDMYLRRYFRRWDWATSTAIIANVAAEVQSRGWAGQRRELPFWRNSGPCAAVNVIAYANGLLDISTGALHAHTPEWCSTFVLPYDYDGAARCPAWLAFMDSVYEGDATRIALLQEYFGYLLSQDTSHEKALVLTGKTRSGKSTIHRIATLLVGEANSTGFSLEKLASDFGPALLIGKTLATVPEVELGGCRDKGRILELWKRIIGRDAIDINIKHKPQISTRLGVRFLVAANDIPRLYDASGAMAARLMYLPHDLSFFGREDRGLASKLEAELPGIANWSLEGLNRLRANGEFTMPDASQRIADTAAIETTPVRAWVRECLEIEPAYDPGDMPGCVVAGTSGFTTTKNGLYNSYATWAKDHDTEADAIKAAAWFFRELRSILPKLKETRLTDPVHGRMMAFCGVRLKRS